MSQNGGKTYMFLCKTEAKSSCFCRKAEAKQENEECKMIILYPKEDNLILKKQIEFRKHPM